jgi:hypothetical protein
MVTLARKATAIAASLVLRTGFSCQYYAASTYYRARRPEQEVINPRGGDF